MIKYKTTGNDESEKENFCCMTNEKDQSCATPYKTMIGGQALIEGIMMLGPEKKAVVVRKPDGELVEQVEHYLNEGTVRNLEALLERLEHGEG